MAAVEINIFSTAFKLRSTFFIYIAVILEFYLLYRERQVINFSTLIFYREIENILS